MAGDYAAVNPSGKAVFCRPPASVAAVCHRSGPCSGESRRLVEGTRWQQVVTDQHIGVPSLPTAASHLFNAKLIQLLGEQGFDDYAEAQAPDPMSRR
jgi:hypothetical protein